MNLLLLIPNDLKKFVVNYSCKNPINDHLIGIHTADEIFCEMPERYLLILSSAEYISKYKVINKLNGINIIVCGTDKIAFNEKHNIIQFNLDKETVLCKFKNTISIHQYCYSQISDELMINNSTENIIKFIEIKCDCKIIHTSLNNTTEDTYYLFNELYVDLFSGGLNIKAIPNNTSSFNYNEKIFLFTAAILLKKLLKKNDKFYLFSNYFDQVNERNLNNISNKNIDGIIDDTSSKTLISICITDLKEEAVQSIKTQLTELFETDNIGYSKGLFHIIAKTNSKNNIYEFNDELFDFLKTNNAFAMCSNMFHSKRRLAAIMLLNTKSLEIEMKLNEIENNRIFYFSDNSFIFILDFFNTYQRRIYPKSGIKYFIHNKIAELYSYDQNNNSNLVKVLYTYITCNKNITETANILFMHRNTVSNKIKQIESIISADLSDINFQSSVILSYKIIQYYETMLDKNFEIKG